MSSTGSNRGQGQRGPGGGRGVGRGGPKGSDSTSKLSKQSMPGSKNTGKLQLPLNEGASTSTGIIPSTKKSQTSVGPGNLPEQHNALVSGYFGDKRIASVLLEFRPGNNPEYLVRYSGLNQSGQASDDFPAGTIVPAADFEARKAQIKEERFIAERIASLTDRLRTLGVTEEVLVANNRLRPVFTNRTEFAEWRSGLDAVEAAVLDSTPSAFCAYFGLDNPRSVHQFDALARIERASQIFPNFRQLLGTGVMPVSSMFTGKGTPGAAAPQEYLSEERARELVAENRLRVERPEDVDDWKVVPRPIYGPGFVSGGRIFVWKGENYERLGAV